MRQMGLKGVIRGKGAEPHGQIRNAAAHRIWYSASSQQAVGFGFHLRFHMAGLCVCGLHHRCVRPRDCELGRLFNWQYRLRNL